MKYKIAVEIPISQVRKLKKAGIISRKLGRPDYDWPLYIVDGEPSLFEFVLKRGACEAQWSNISPSCFWVFPQWHPLCEVQFNEAYLYLLKPTSAGLGPFVNSSNGKVIKISPPRGAENWKFVEGVWRFNSAAHSPIVGIDTMGEVT